MFPNVVFSLICLMIPIFSDASIYAKVFVYILSATWFIFPFVMWNISKEKVKSKKVDKLSEEEKEYLKKISEKTWGFFAKYMTKENNYLPPDNYQESRREKVVDRTSVTNIGLRTSCDCICL